MALITLPASIKPRSFTLTPFVSQRASASPFGGSEQAIDLLNDRWLASFQIPVRKFDEAAAVEAFIASMRGQVNTVALHHFARPTVRGTIAGARTLAATAAQGAASLSVTATGTLLAGDMVGVGGLLLMVAQDCASAAGVITVPLGNRLRRAVAAGSVLTITRPTAEFRMLSNSGVNYVPGYAEVVSFDFGEKI